MNKRSMFLLGVIMGGALTLAIAPQVRKEMIQKLKQPFKSLKVDEMRQEVQQPQFSREELDQDLEQLSQRVEALLQ